MINAGFIKYLPIVFILFFALFLRIERLGSLMPFIGDQGWFYLSARDMWVSGQLPLVGITSSHTWLHQGPLWTYVLALSIGVFNFHPAAGAYLAAILGVVSVFLIYKLGKDFFSERVGLIAALLFATSPLVIIHSRFAYHTSPIPLIVLLLLYAILATIKGRKEYIYLAAFSLSILYNLELATVVFAPVLLAVFLFGIYKREKWTKNISNKKVLIYSLIALSIPMVPILIYDVYNGFPQTVKYAGWFVYKGLQFLGFYPKSVGAENINQVLDFFIGRYQFLSFMAERTVSLLLLAGSLSLVSRDAFKKITSPIGIVFLGTSVPLLGLILSRTSSEAYLPMLFPGLIFSIAYVFDKFLNTKLKAFVFVVLIIMCVGNIYYIRQADYLAGKDGGFGMPISIRIEAARKIIKLSRDKTFTIGLIGPGSEFKSATMNYEYLVWWLSGKSPEKGGDVKITIHESKKGVEVKSSIK